MPDAATLLACAVLGACVGSFLDVCIHRLPRNASVVHPPSRCEACGTRISWYDNLPIISALFRRGRCRWCGFRFGYGCLIGEVGTALLTVLGVWAGFTLVADKAWVMEHHWLALAGVPPAWVGAASAGALLIMLYGLWISARIDLDHSIIQDEVVMPLQALAPLLAWFCPLNLTLGWSPEAWFTTTTLGGLRPAPLAGLLPLSLWVIPSLMGLMVSLPIARWIYGTYFAPAQRWSEEDHRGFAAGVRWFVLVSGLQFGVAVALVLGAASVSDPCLHRLAVQATQALLGSLAGWWVLYGLGLVATVIAHRNAMGFGDVKLLAPMGALLGPVGVGLTLAGAALVGSLVGTIRLLRGRGREIPFAPFLAIGAVLAPWTWLAWRWYFRC